MPNWAYQEIHCKTKEDLEKIKAHFETNDELNFEKIIPMPLSIKLTQSPAYSRAIAFFLSPDEKPLTKEEIIEKIDTYKETLTNALDTKFVNIIYSEFDKIGGHNKKLIDILWETLQDKKLLKILKENIKNIDSFKEYCDALHIDPSPANYGKQILYNLLTTGKTNWYDWSNEYWETKWNASNTAWTDKSVYFETAWSPALKIAQKISELLKIDLFVEWAEEQMTEYGGIVQFNKGVPILSEDFKAGSKEMFNVASRLSDSDQECIRYDENHNEIITEWDFDYDTDYKEKYGSFTNIPKVDTTIYELEEFLKQ